MTTSRHAHTRHHVADAHGRVVDLTVGTPGLAPASIDRRQARDLPSRGHPWGAVAVCLVAVVTSGLVVTVLLVVIRDIVSTVAGTSATGLILKLLTPSSRRVR
ncbi:hypothetical protein [Streptomyces aureus]|uniref:hypothetical protein n=1 Tax=Streptomyces aureus TaxID=193461 RepID=UPI00367F792B